ncbi:MAG: energy transducer TonB [Thermaurantiacus sp.]
MPANRLPLPLGAFVLLLGATSPASSAPTGADGITLPRAIPQSLRPRPTDYPDVSINRSERGVSGILLTVDEAGRVRGCETYRSSGHERLDKRACQIARQRWRFEPGTRNGRPVQVSFVSYYLWDFARQPIPAAALPNIPAPHLPGQEQQQP